MTDWMKQYPSTSLTRKHKGDRVIAETYRGEANKLLYQLKNLMTFRNLGQLKMTRLFTDGTVITAKSHFGYDTVEIDVTKRLAVGEMECTITLIDLPDAIPPMKYPGEIHVGEVEGIDYVKTYYTVDVSRCLPCGDPDFSVCDTAEITADDLLPEEDRVCKPFYFVDTTVEGTEADPDDHCLISTSHCQAEIISFDEDGGGTYFLWKGYTEWPPDDMTASGLGYMLLTGFIKITGETEELCASGDVTVRVDCCEKNSDEYKAAHPEWDDLDIGYTSLLMNCGQTQELTAEYGCSPYIWTLTSGGGTLTPSEDGLTVIYQAPATNPDCVDHPVITLEDRCENSTTLYLTVNCYYLEDRAYGITRWELCGDFDQLCSPGVPITIQWYTVYFDYYRCDGVYLYTDTEECASNIRYNDVGPPTSAVSDCVGSCLPYRGTVFEMYDDCTFVSCWNCYWGVMGDPFIGDKCGYDNCLNDWRTPAMKAAGCCPINPDTGLPY